ncbi:hypothetical protein QQ045_004867 [Rhodiola kirilowii]
MIITENILIRWKWTFFNYTKIKEQKSSNPQFNNHESHKYKRIETNTNTRGKKSINHENHANKMSSKPTSTWNQTDKNSKFKRQKPTQTTLFQQNPETNFPQ